ncbi:lipopolysaccharide biosynthesis protein [Micromonospora yangpuensis]|uniref:Capsular polysaccharide biosynthesis protein n=1 Tax=Micromonospora yangpuensis TaxID=683228 RepID=A0A1C6UIJ0_9ACTN|nr:lipopolysaccharide biosynthesis protein [Micromonospora yangpuensis]GGM03318.1 hypothetical protein GCM10012279_21260 [Micromonospora yangpuensis]SCL53774.1 hypothetical protein GA0070617_2467 [Micromonospora yangpuensis]
MTEHASAGWSPADRPTGPPARTVTITDVLRVPLHRIRLVAAIAGSGLLAALTFVMLAPAAVTASAVVAVRPVVTDAFTPTGGSPDRSVNMNVESGIATGTDVVSRIAEAVGRPSVEVRNALEVEVPTGGQILRFVYQGRTVDESVETVNVAARSYLDVRREMYESQRNEMLRSYDASIAKVTEQQTTLQKRIDRNRGTAAADAAVSELAAVNNQLTQLNSARSEIAAVDVNPGWLTQTAEPELANRDGSRMLYLLAGLLGGTLIGVVAAYGWESIDRRIRTVADGREVTGLPLLGTVRRRRVPGRAQLVDADVRYVAMAIAAQVSSPARVAVLTTREDSTATTAGLAVALAADGRPVFVADDSGRAGRLREAVLAGSNRLPFDRVAVAQQPHLPNGTAPPVRGTGVVSVPTAAGGTAGAGTAPNRRPSPYPAAARTSGDPDATAIVPRVTSGRAAAPGRIVDARRGGAEPAGDGSEITVGPGSVRIGTARQAVGQPLVLYNAPPAESDERGVALARQGTAVIVVVQDRTRQTDLRRLVERLRAAGVSPIGFVLTRGSHG